MPKTLPLLVTLAISALIALGLGYSRLTLGQSAGIELIAVDMNTAGNTATSLGPRQECLDALPGQTIEIDITAHNIPSSTAMIAYAYTLHYDGPDLTITDQEPLLILSSPGSSLLNASDTVPDFDGDFAASVVDLTVEEGATESGSGVLDRLTIEIGTDASPGAYSLTLTGAAHIDDTNTPFPAASIADGRLAIGVACSGSTPIAPKTQGPPSSPGTDPDETDSPPDDTEPPPIETPGDGETPDGPSLTPTPANTDGSPTPASATRTPPDTQVDDDDDDDDGGGLSILIIVAAVLVAVAVAGGAGWLAYRRYAGK